MGIEPRPLQYFFLSLILYVILKRERQRRGRLLIRQWDGRCSLPCEEEQVKLTCQGVSQTQADQAWVHSVSIDNGEQRGKNNQKTEKKVENEIILMRHFG